MASDDIYIDSLISLVEQKPVLWDKSLDDHKSRILTTAAWQDVCLELHHDFKSLSHMAKNNYGRLVLKKWTNVKDSWHKAQKRKLEQKTSGACAKSSKKYLYDQQMSFLEKNIIQKETVSSLLSDDMQNNESDAPQPSASGPSEEICPTQPIKVKKKRKLEDIEQKMLNTVETPENRHFSFFKGIIPSLEKFSEEQTLQFQMGVLNVLQNVRQGRPYFEPPHIYPHPYPMSYMYPHHNIPKNQKVTRLSSLKPRTSNVEGGSPYTSSSDMSDNSDYIDFGTQL